VSHYSLFKEATQHKGKEERKRGKKVAVSVGDNSLPSGNWWLAEVLKQMIEELIGIFCCSES
jgi:hypothetical protein